MKILIISHEYPPHVTSGPGRYIVNLTKELIEKGHKVTVITPLVRGYGKTTKHEIDNGIEVHRLPLFQSEFLDNIIPDVINKRFSFNTILKKFMKDFDLSRYDLMHIIDEHISYFLNKDIASKIPIAISINAYYPLEISWNIFKFPYYATDLPLRYVYYMINKMKMKRYLPLANAWISDTKYAANIVLNTTKVDKKGMNVVYKGKDLSKFSDKISEDKYQNQKILYVGGNMERKGVVYLVMAMPIILKKYPKAKLTIIGRCSWLYQKKLEQIIKKENLKEAVEFVPHVAPQNIPKYFQDANVFTMAPIIEDLAQVLLEAMATKTPVVCTDVGANGEGIIEGKTGFLVENKDYKGIAEKIIKLFDNPKLAKEFGNNGRERVKIIFEKERMFEETLDIYKKIVTV